METAVILLRRNARGRVSLMYSSHMWGLTKGRPWTWDISADLRKALNKEVRKNLGAKYVEEFNRPPDPEKMRKREEAQKKMHEDLRSMGADPESIRKKLKEPVTLEEMLEEEWDEIL